MIRRPVVSGGHGHHGGAWKVAYADFVTAMMAFFLLLWLISSASEDTLKGLAEFFSNATVNIGPPGGVGGVLDGMTVVPSSVPPLPSSPFDQQPALPDGTVEPVDEVGVPSGEASAIDPATSSGEVAERQERAAFDQAKAAILAAMQVSPELRGLKDSLLIENVPEGLRVQILDREQLPMFPVGSDRMYAHTKRLLEVVATAVAGLPNRVSLRGHTDSLPFAAGAASDNWRLSADRANATRLAMTGAGLDAKRIAEVVGKADADPLVAARADDPRNRRISIVLLRQAAGQARAAPSPPGR